MGRTSGGGCADAERNVMWRAALGTVLGAGAGYLVWDLAWNAIQSCQTTNMPADIPTPPGVTPEERAAIFEQNMDAIERSGAQCTQQHPIAKAIGDGPFGFQWMGVAAVGALLGGIVGHYALRRL
jgi:hypothetical protein